jgi:hypothetical protein
MRLIYTISLLSFFIFPASKAQSEPRLAIGVNMSNNLVNLLLGNYNYAGGYCFEPLLLYKINDYINFKSVVGYSKISNRHTLINTSAAYQELNYINKGGYIKMGIFTRFKPKKKLFCSSFGLSLVYSQFNESGNYTIHGNYFGDLRVDFKVSAQRILFIEPGIDIYLFQNNYFALLTSFKFPIGISYSIRNEFPNYYIPGFGERSDSQAFNFNSIYYRFDFYILIPIRLKKDLI